MTQKDGGWLAAEEMFKNGCGVLSRVKGHRDGLLQKWRWVDQRRRGAAEAQRGVDGEVVWEGMKGREDEAQLRRLSKGDVG